MRGTFKAVLATALTVGIMTFASQVYAVTLDTSSTEYLGKVEPGVPSNEADELAYVNALLSLALGDTTVVGDPPQDNLVTRDGNACSGGICEAATDPAKTETDDATGIDVSGFTYLLAKYGGGLSLVFDVTGLTEVDIPAQGLSHYTLFTPGDTPQVPEPATLLLLGGAMVGLGVWRRKR